MKRVLSSALPFAIAALGFGACNAPTDADNSDTGSGGGSEGGSGTGSNTSGTGSSTSGTGSSTSGAGAGSNASGTGAGGDGGAGGSGGDGAAGGSASTASAGGGNPASCGDGMCNGGESCQTCEADCGACPPACGDASCMGAETCSTCEADCGPCPVECCLDQPPGALWQDFTACGNGGSHYGIDYGTPIGTPIYAGMSGTVFSHALGYPNCYNNGCDAQCWMSYNYIALKSGCGDPNVPPNDFYILYLHIDDLAPGIADGMHVDKGELIAYSGNSGCSSAPHIHLETVSVPPGGSGQQGCTATVNPETRYCP